MPILLALYEEDFIESARDDLNFAVITLKRELSGSMQNTKCAVSVLLNDWDALGDTGILVFGYEDDKDADGYVSYVLPYRGVNWGNRDGKIIKTVWIAPFGNCHFDNGDKPILDADGGSRVYLKNVAFFATEADAEAYAAIMGGEPPTTEARTDPPTAAPTDPPAGGGDEGNEGNGGGNATNAPGSSSDKTDDDGGNLLLIIGIAAAAVVVVVVIIIVVVLSKKKKKAE